MKPSMYLDSKADRNIFFNQEASQPYESYSGAYTGGDIHSALKTPFPYSANWPEGGNINTHRWKELKESGSGLSYESEDTENPYPSWDRGEDTPISADSIHSVMIRLGKVFVFQSDNIENMFDYLMKLLDSRAARLSPGIALRSIHADYIWGPSSNFRQWYLAAEMNKEINSHPLKNCDKVNSSAEAKEESRFSKANHSDMVTHVGLYLLCWGEANNVRFIPECLCFIFNCCLDYLSVLEQGRRTTRKTLFLDSVITPIYSVLRNQCFEKEGNSTVRTSKDHSGIIGYDDINQLFWSKQGLQRLVLRNKGKIMDLSPQVRLNSIEDIDWDKCFTKTFNEKRSWIHVFVDFKRVIIIHIALFWYFHSYHSYPMYTPNYLISRDDKPSIELRLTIMSLASILVLLFCTITSACEFYILPRKWRESCSLILRFSALLGFSAIQIMTIILGYYFDLISKQSIAGLIFSIFQFLGSIITVVFFAITPTSSLLSLPSSKELISGSKSFTENFSQLRRSQTGASIGLWTAIFTSKCVESYFYLTLSTRDPIRELVMMKTNCVGDIWVGQHLCSLQPQIILGILITLEFLLFFIDTYLWYIIWITIFSVVRSFYIGSSIWTPWRNIFSGLPRRIYSKLLVESKKRPIENDSRVPKLWNTIVISMYREHFLSLEQVQKLLYNRTKDGKNPSFQEPGFFVSQEDDSFHSSLLSKNSESSRRLTFFAQSMSTAMPESKSIERMPSFSVLVPHYREKIILLLLEIEKEEGRFSSLTIIEYLKQLHPLEWKNFVRDSKILAEGSSTENYSPKKSESSHLPKEVDCESLDLENNMRTRIWASLRTQTLYRTISGFMNYSRAIKILFDLEEFEDSDDYSNLRLRALDNMAMRKFKMIVSMQRFTQFSREEKENVELLLRVYPELQIAYIEERMDKDSKIATYYLCLIDGSCPTLQNQEREPKYRIKLSGYPILGDGKSDNQNHALIFTRGEYIQLIDANQDNYFEECLKIRNVLAEFEEDCLNNPSHPIKANSYDAFPVAIVGTREYIFSENMGILGDIAAGKEQTFGTLFARTLAYIGGKLHYGHPDFLNAIFMSTRGGISKAQKGLHLNEDIYAGMNAVMRGGRIKYCEYMQCGKGRDLGFVSILNFVNKIGAGMGEQLISREYFHLGSQLPIDRFLSFYFAHAGYHINNLCIMLSLELFLLLGINLGVLTKGSTICEYNRNRPFTDPRTPQNCLNLIPVVLWLRKCIFSIFVACIISFVPLGIQELTEKGIYRGLKRLGKQIFSLSPFFEVFSCKTYTYAMVNDMNFGGAQYIGTGRGIATKRETFVTLYSKFANVSLKFGAESLFLIACMTNYLWSFSLLYFWIIVMGLLFSPFLYNPSQYVLLDVVLDFRNFWIWLFSGNNRDRTLAWVTFTKASRGQISGVLARPRMEGGIKLSSSIRPTRIHLLLTIAVPKALKTLIIGCAYLFVNSQSGYSFGLSSNALERIIVLSSFPIIVNMILLIAVFAVSLILGPVLTLFFKQLPSILFIITHVAAILNYVFIFEVIWFLQNFDLSQTLLAIILLVNYQGVLLTTMSILFLSRELDSDSSNKAWWSGKWINAGLGWRIITQPTREYFCKLSELSYFTADFFLGQFLISTQFSVLLIPFINRWHSNMLLWLKSDHHLRKRDTPAQDKREKTVTIIFFVFVFILTFAFMALLIAGPVLVNRKYELDNIMPHWIVQLKQPQTPKTNSRGLKRAQIKSYL